MSESTAARPRAAGPRTTVVIRIDWQALVRGHSHQGDTCEIRGVGPVPVSVARQVMADAFLKAVIIDGTDITRVQHFGRTIPAEVRTALEERDGYRCQAPGCSHTGRLQVDHITPHAGGGPTATTNLQLLCNHHHTAKTRADRARGWTGPDPP